MTWKQKERKSRSTVTRGNTTDICGDTCALGLSDGETEAVRDPSRDIVDVDECSTLPAVVKVVLVKVVLLNDALLLAKLLEVLLHALLSAATDLP